jgi:Zn-dependent peptidase ImmA (M78 family)/transcriptional regulator with XRE-family HTH domain
MRPSSVVSVATMSAVGSEIRNLRESLGFAVGDMAQKARLALDRALEIEAGSPLTTQELASLAAALGTDASSLLRGRLTDPRRSVARFRSAHGVGAAGSQAVLSGPDLRLLSIAAEVGRIGAYLNDLLGRPAPAVAQYRSPCAVRAHPIAWKQGYDLGKTARSRFAPTRDPIPSVQRELESAGIHVAFVAFQTTEIEAASLFESDSIPVILLNKSAYRVGYRLARRAILAHELCHLLHDGGERDLLTVVSRQADDSPIEQRANGFAPSFIAPRSLVALRARNKMPLVLELAQTWGLSFEGAVWHAKNIELLSAETAERMLQGRKPRLTTEFEEDIPRTPPEQFDIPTRASDLANGLLSELAIMAVADGAISKGRAAEILALA